MILYSDTANGDIPGLDDNSELQDPQAVECTSQDPDDYIAAVQPEPATYKGRPAYSRTNVGSPLRNGHGAAMSFPAGIEDDEPDIPDDTVADEPPDDEPLPRGVYRARFLRYYTNFNHPERRNGNNGPEHRGKCVVQYEIVDDDYVGRVLDRHFNVWFPQGAPLGSIHFLPADKRGRLFREASAVAGKRARRERCVSELRSNPRVWILVSSVEQDAEGFAIESFASYSRIERIIGNIELMPESQAREKAGV